MSGTVKVVDDHSVTQHYLSVCSSVRLCIVALRVGVEDLKLYCRVPSRQLPIHFFRHFCCRMYSLAAKRSKKNEPPKLFHGLQYG